MEGTTAPGLVAVTFGGAGVAGGVGLRAAGNRAAPTNADTIEIPRLASAMREFSAIPEFHGIKNPLRCRLRGREQGLSI